MVLDERQWKQIQVRADHRAEWMLCPVCGSGHIEAGSVDVEDTNAWQHVECSACQSDWVEVYEASHREHIVDRSEEVFD